MHKIQNLFAVILVMLMITFIGCGETPVTTNMNSENPTSDVLCTYQEDFYYKTGQNTYTSTGVQLTLIWGVNGPTVQVDNPTQTTVFIKGIITWKSVDSVKRAPGQLPLTIVAGPGTTSKTYTWTQLKFTGGQPTCVNAMFHGDDGETSWWGSQVRGPGQGNWFRWDSFCKCR